MFDLDVATGVEDMCTRWPTNTKSDLQKTAVVDLSIHRGFAPGRNSNRNSVTGTSH